MPAPGIRWSGWLDFRNMKTKSRPDLLELMLQLKACLEKRTQIPNRLMYQLEKELNIPTNLKLAKGTCRIGLKPSNRLVNILAAIRAWHVEFLVFYRGCLRYWKSHK